MKEWTAFKIEKCVQAVYARVNTLLQTSQQNLQAEQCFSEQAEDLDSLAICHQSQKTGSA